MTFPAILLSLRPRFAQAILDGTKTVEVRRRPIRAPRGTILVLYASSPTMAILGTAELGAVNVRHPDVAWKEYENDLGLSREEFTTYLNGSDSAHLIHVWKPRRLNEPIPLSCLRASASGFKPPQSFRYITAEDPPPLLTALT